MSGVKNFLLLFEDGEPLLTYDSFAELLDEKDPALLSGFLMAIQKFIIDFGETGEGIVEMHKSKIIFLKDPKTHLYFVLNCEEWANNKKISKILSKIQKRFAQKFKDHLTKFSPQQLQGYINNIFKFDLEELVT